MNILSFILQKTLAEMAVDKRKDVYLQRETKKNV